MRIVAGRYRGKALVAPEGDTTRPTSDRARESIFNVLDSRLRRDGISWDGLTVADVFAGTGAMGLEAVSRGVQSVVFMENDARAMVCLRQNAQRAVQDGVKVSFLGDVFGVAPAGKACALLFSDAPYQKQLTERALTVLSAKGYIDKDTLCVVECEKNEKIVFPNGFDVEDKRVYGRAAFYLLSFHQK